MKYIDKSSHLEAGNSITDDYLKDVCRVGNDNDYCYQNVDYDGTFGNHKDEIRQLALENQSNFCCYCMRNLSQQNQVVTLEHIIPQNSSRNEFDKYINLNVFPLTRNEVTLTGDFVGIHNVSVPPRPHTVTYENLTASCNGTFPDKQGTSQCCNNYRGNKFVFPMFYIKDIESELVYMEDGTIEAKYNCVNFSEYQKTISAVNLNCSNLKCIRRLWHLFAGTPVNELWMSIHDLNLRSKLLYGVLYKDLDKLEQDSIIQVKFMKTNYWLTFLLYSWFHNKI